MQAFSSGFAYAYALLPQPCMHASHMAGLDFVLSICDAYTYVLSVADEPVPEGQWHLASLILDTLCTTSVCLKAHAC